MRMETTTIRRVAITGASGFIGRYLMSELANRPLERVAVGRDSHRLADLPGHPRPVLLDLLETTADPYEALGRPDLLIHLAWEGLDNYRALHHFEVQLPAHYRFLERMVRSGLRHLFVAGTCFEYGLQLGALDEGLPCLPLLPYGYAKDALHRQLQLLQQEQPFRLIWGRLFYMFGEGQAPQSLFPLLMSTISRRERSFPMSAGEQLRDYLPVAEVARLISELSLTKSATGAVNICSGSPVSIRRLVEGWCREAGATIELDLGHYPYPDYEPLAFWGDRRRLDSLLGG
jgi:dTDP-6-deoxy-L-talose 4-dehydrogenase (NAD+)